MIATEEPILPRLDRLDNILKHLEEMRGVSRSPRSSYASTPSSGNLTSEGQRSSADFSPKSLEKHCRPIEAVMVETEHKGTLIERLVHVEDRVLKLEDELEAEKERAEKASAEKKPRKKGLKKLVKSFVKGKSGKDEGKGFV